MLRRSSFREWSLRCHCFRSLSSPLQHVFSLISLRSGLEIARFHKGVAAGESHANDPYVTTLGSDLSTFMGAAGLRNPTRTLGCNGPEQASPRGLGSRGLRCLVRANRWSAGRVRSGGSRGRKPCRAKRRRVRRSGQAVRCARSEVVGAGCDGAWEGRKVRAVSALFQA